MNVDGKLFVWCSLMKLETHGLASFYHYNINYETNTAYMHLPQYSKLSEDSTEEEIVDLTTRSARFLGVHAIMSHCSEVQHAHLLEIITMMCNAYNELLSR